MALSLLSIFLPVVVPTCGPVLIYLFMRYCLRRKPSLLRIYSLCCWIFFWVYVVYLITSSTTTWYENFLEDEVFVLNMFVYISMPSFYIVIIFECWFSNERQYIVNLGNARPTGEYLKDLRRAQPEIIWTVACYHMETRYRTVSDTDSNGNTQFRTETYQERVTTYRETEKFRYGYWFDHSDPKVEGIERYRITRIKLDTDFIPGDVQTEQTLDRLKQAVKDRNKWKDDHMDFKEERTMSGYKERVAAYVDKEHKSCWIGQWQFWMASLYGLTWPYRWLFMLLTGKTYYTLKKTIYLSRPEKCNYEIKEYGETLASVQNTDDVKVGVDEVKDCEGEQTVSDTDRLITIPVDVHRYGAVN